MKKYFFLAIAGLCALTLNAKTIYLNTGGASLWGQADPVFFVHSWSSPEDNADVMMTFVEGDVFSADINDAHNNVLFVRMPTGSTELNWDTKWNQTGDLVIPEGQDLYTITGWEATDGSWSVYGDNPGPQPTGDHTWYYKGYIDGQDVEPSESTMFTRGIAEFACVEKSYLMVIYQEPGKPGVQYMAETYVDGGDNCVLKNTTTVDKWGIEPYAGNLYLYEGDDATSVILSKVEIPGRKLVDENEAQAVENISAENAAVKFIENGEIRIRRGNQVYDVTGMQIR
ncbi:MAG: hypothetical protein MJZ53_06745 [Paludibacteraceae bacterium]|nr:hypothetical protein [Paludibacteraceae bacterium]